MTRAKWAGLGAALVIGGVVWGWPTRSPREDVGGSEISRLEPPAASQKPASEIPEPIKEDSSPQPVVDSAMAGPDALGRGRFPGDVVTQMRLVEVRYFGFDDKIHVGQIVVHRDVVAEVKAIFAELLEAKWPIARIIPVAKYGWDDDTSVAANNSSGFNYRRTIGPGRGHAMSMHAYGRAIDLNPYQNPFLDADGRGDSEYDTAAKGTITRQSVVYRAFRKRGWRWGGDWGGSKDYQHFEKGSRKL